jgi:uncharacterized protein GlcG (DUF336 family)
MDVLEKVSVSTTAASILIDAACEHAAELGLAIAVAVVDESGILKAFRRMDGAPLIAVSTCRTKALTAAGFGLPTGTPWLEFIRGDPILEAGVPQLEDFTFLGGGHPLTVGAMVVGAIGVSGGHYRQDEACVQAALAAVADSK